MTEEQRLIALLTEEMERLRPLLTQAALVLNQRGTRDLRKRIGKEFNHATITVRTLRHHIDGTDPGLFDDPIPAAPVRRCAFLRLVVNNERGGDHAA